MMMRRFSGRQSLCAVLGCILLAPPPLFAFVDLEWRARDTVVPLGDVVEVDLYAWADSIDNESVASFEVVFTWDAARLQLLNNVDPCDEEACLPGTYDWLDSGFPKDANGDGLNADCSADVFCDPYTRLPFNDGNALYWALAQFAPRPPALVTPEGLWITTIRFQAIDTGAAEIRFEARLGEVSRTLVAGSRSDQADLTGVLGPPASVEIAVCSTPTIAAVGSRYLAVTPAPQPDPVAILITGDSVDPDLTCITTYVQPDGRLDVTPVYRTPDEWGTVYVSGPPIVPSGGFLARAQCPVSSNQELVSEAARAVTWLWGDVNNDGVVFLDDVSLVIDGTHGVFPGDTIPENLDLAPCEPDGTIDDRDVASVQAALGGLPFPCRMPCDVGHDLDDLAVLIECLTGPAGGVTVPCFLFDGDNDRDVDLADFLRFQLAFDAQ